MTINQSGTTWIYRLAYLLLGVSLNVGATPGGHPQADDALQALLQVLEQETAIATKTKMNIDFVPGMVSVLYGEDLLAKGVRNAGEAIALIPGVELSMSSDGQGQVSVRGIGTVWSSGKIKVLLNGVPFHSTLSVATTAYQIPVEQIARIEVIRGPGSAIHGESAYSGVVNIITHKKGDHIFIRYGDLGRKTVGGLLSRTFKQSDWALSLNFSGTDSGGDFVESGPDVLSTTPFAPVSRAPGPVNEKGRDRYLLLHAGRRDFSLSVQYGQVDSGDAFGLAHALPDPEPRIMRKVGMLSVNAEQHWAVKKDLSISARLGWLDYKLDSGLHEFYPPNINFGLGAFPDGLIGSPNYEERKYHVGAELNFTGSEEHDLLLGLEWLYTDQGDTFAERNYDPATPVPAPIPLNKFTGDGNWLEEGLTRRVLGLFVQDQFAINKKITVTAGVRHDRYSDVGNATSPRLAAVYQYSDRQTFKAQYARAFRPPTFLETATKNNPVVTASPDIESELIDNYELGYIFNDGVNTVRATAFLADLHDLIVIDPASNTYVNQGEVHVKGVEMEFVRQFGRDFKLDANITYVEAKDKSNNEPVADVAKVMANMGVTYKFRPEYIVAVQYRYVGKRARAPADMREDLDGYDIVDVTATAKHFFVDGMSLRLGVKNLFDEDVRYPAPLVNFAGSVLPAYEEDYPRPGREYWVQADYKF